MVAKEIRKQVLFFFFLNIICRTLLACVIFAAFPTPLNTRQGWKPESGDQRVARRGHGNEGMRATLLIRVYLTAPQLHSCLHHGALHALRNFRLKVVPIYFGLINARIMNVPRVNSFNNVFLFLDFETIG